MPVVATVDLDGALSDDADDLLAAFVGSELRGVAQAQVLGGTAYYFLTVGADDEGETVTFRTYDASERTVRSLCEAVAFRSDLRRGTVGEPFGLGASDGGSSGTCPSRWAAVPGYTNVMTLFVELLLPTGEASTDEDLIAAVVADEVRGVGAPFGAGGNQRFRIEVEGIANGETVEFQAYDSSTGTPYFTNTRLPFAGGETAGTPSAPLIVRMGEVLPVELTSFTITRHDARSATLRWVTASETNNAGFHVEHASPGRSAPAFVSVGYVEGGGTVHEVRQYHHALHDLPSGTHAFRLRQVDYDGTYSYSPVVEIEISGTAPLESHVYPNPLRAPGVIALAVQHTQQVQVVLHDALGRRVRTFYDGELGEASPLHLRLDISGLAPGAYLLRIAGELASETHVLHIAH